MAATVIHIRTSVHGRRGGDGEVFIGRPSKWGNRFTIGRDGDRATVIAKYRRWILTRPALLDALGELDGQRLVCFCHPQPCHGDVLAELVARMHPGRASASPGETGTMSA